MDIEQWIYYIDHKLLSRTELDTTETDGHLVKKKSSLRKKKAEAAVTLCKNKKIAILAPILNLTQNLSLTLGLTLTSATNLTII